MLGQRRLSKLQGMLGWKALTRWKETVAMVPPSSCNSVEQNICAAGNRDSRGILNETEFHWEIHIF